jgi:hypothetical protein
MPSRTPRFESKRPGQVFKMRVGDRGFAFAQYVLWTDDGPMFRLYDTLVNGHTSFEQIVGTPSRFIVVGGIPGALKAGWWTLAGRLPVSSFTHPRFRFTFAREPGVHHDWKIWDGKSEIFVGDLTPELRSLEFRCGWSPQALEKRLLTGRCFADDLL